MSVRDWLLEKLTKQPPVQQQVFIDPDTGEEYTDDEDIDQGDEIEDLLANDLTHTAGGHDKLVDGIIWVCAVFGTPILWFVLGLGNAQLFAGYKSFNLADPWVALSYLCGFAYEFFGVALILLAGRSYARKRYGMFAGSLSGAIFMAGLSFFAQYALYQSEWTRHVFNFPDSSILNLPVTHVQVFFFRALAPTILEFTIVFLFAERKPNAMETLRKKQEVQQELMTYQQGQALLKQHKAASQSQILMIEAATQQINDQFSLFHEHGLVRQQHNPLLIEKEVPQRQLASPKPQQAAQSAQQAPRMTRQPSGHLHSGSQRSRDQSHADRQKFTAQQKPVPEQETTRLAPDTQRPDKPRPTPSMPPQRSKPQSLQDTARIDHGGPLMDLKFRPPQSGKPMSPEAIDKLLEDLV